MINQGDSIATVKTKIADALALAGVAAPTSWADATDKINERAVAYGLDTIADDMAGGTARARVNAIIDASAYDPASFALFARFTTPPTSTRKALINDLIVALKDGGVWSKLDALWLMAAADAQGAKLNWVADQYNLIPVSSPIFTADRGYTGNGSTSYLETGLVLNAAANFALNDAHVSVYSRTNQSDVRVILGARDSGPIKQTLVQSRTATGNINGRINQSLLTGDVAIPSSAGHLLVQRTGSTVKGYYRNATLLGTATETSDGVTGFSLSLLALNTDGDHGSFDNRQVASASVGASLSGSEVSAYYTALNTYLTAIGASV